MNAFAGRSRGASLGKVYFLQSGDRPVVKIGWTLDVEARLKQLQCGNPDVLKLLGTVRGTVALERGWHARFQHLFIRGEWFNLNDELIAAIKDRGAVSASIKSASFGELVPQEDMAAYILSLRRKQDRNDLYPRGSESKSSKLDESKVTEILLDNRSLRAIAKDYGVGTMTVHAIKARRSWLHVDDPRLSRLTQEAR